jgi:hypothetical protein
MVLHRQVPAAAADAAADAAPPAVEAAAAAADAPEPPVQTPSSSQRHHKTPTMFTSPRTMVSRAQLFAWSLDLSGHMTWVNNATRGHAREPFQPLAAQGSATTASREACKALSRGE